MVDCRTSANKPDCFSSVPGHCSAASSAVPSGDGMSSSARYGVRVARTSASTCGSARKKCRRRTRRPRPARGVRPRVTIAPPPPSSGRRPRRRPGRTSRPCPCRRRAGALAGPVRGARPGRGFRGRVRTLPGGRPPLSGAAVVSPAGLTAAREGPSPRSLARTPR